MKNKKILSLILVIVLALTAMPMTTAFAATITINLGSGLTTTLNTDTGVLTISGAGQITNILPSDYQTSVTSIVINEGVTSITAYSFKDCSSLTSIVLPESITSIGYQAFAGCTNLTDVTIQSTIVRVQNHAFDDCPGTNIALPDVITLSYEEGETGVLNTNTGLLTISGSGAIMYDNDHYIFNNYVRSVVIEEGVTDSVGGIFKGYTNLTSYDLPDSMHIITNSMFQGCTGLTEIDLSESAYYIGDKAFADCSNVATIINRYVGDQTVGTNAFQNAGSAVSTEKRAYAAPTNTTFASAATAAGYTLYDLDTLDDPIGTDIIQINGAITATNISVTHPASVEYTIDPNLGYEGGAFIAPDIAITNNSIVPVNVTVKSLASATGGTLQFTDVAPTAYDWPTLNTEDSERYIALGVQIVDGTGWSAGYNTETKYAVDIDNTLFGTLASEATGRLDLAANYGLVFDQSFTSRHNFVLMFDLV